MGVGFWQKEIAGADRTQAEHIEDRAGAVALERLEYPDVRDPERTIALWHHG
jgi:hypothetical protein